MLHENENNFRLHISEIRDAVVEPPARLALSGTQVGRLSLSIQGGKMIRLEFAEVGEMKTALDLLAQRLNSTLRINVEWNDSEHRFQKKKMLPVAAPYS